MRKFGSSVIASAMGLALLILGLCVLWRSPAFLFRNAPSFHGNEKYADGFTCIVFGIVLLWWAILGEAFEYKKRTHAIPKIAYAPWKVLEDWGIGIPTITMVIGVITSVVAIFTLTHEINKPETAQQPQTIVTNQFNCPSNPEPVLSSAKPLSLKKLPPNK